MIDVFNVNGAQPGGGQQPAPVHTTVELAPYQGKPPGAYLPGSDWRIWLKRLENFMKLRKVDNDSKKYVFLEEIGDLNYAILEGLLPGKDLEEHTYEQLRDAMTERYQPKVLVLSERFRLTQLTQKNTQNLAEFLAELQNAAKSFKFETVKDVRDAFVSLAFISDIKSDDTRKKLIEQNEKTSQELLASAEAHERAGKGAVDVRHTGESVHGVNNMKRQTQVRFANQNKQFKNGQSKTNHKSFQKGNGPFQKKGQSKGYFSKSTHQNTNNRGASCSVCNRRICVQTCLSLTGLNHDSIVLLQIQE